MADEVGVSGLAEIRETLLKRLPEAIQGKASQIALTKAAAPIVRDANANAPSGIPKDFVGPLKPTKRAKLKGSVFSRRNPDSTKTYESRLIGVRKRAFWWRWIEFGRGVITRSKKGSLGTVAKGWFGKTVKAVPAKPFLRPAFEANKLRAIEIYKQNILPAIERVAARSRARTLTSIRKKITGF